ncbi:MAG: ATP-binding protein [Muribaculaceae bacterium]|nr:ATP-binding protein [Muribaculaceae bacterium]
MLYRKIQLPIERFLTSNSNKILVLDGARQVGKTFIIRHVGQKLFPNFIEINLKEDAEGDRAFARVHTVKDFYLRLSVIAGQKMGNKSDTLVFLDEIQSYPHLLTMLKFLKDEDRFTYVASGSLLGVTLSKTASIPIGSIETYHLYPLDFEEFLIANGVGQEVLNHIHDCFANRTSLDETLHRLILDKFKRYLLCGGLPDAVNTLLDTDNIVQLRRLQHEIHAYYGADASQYDANNRLKIRRVYDMIPSNLENKRKRVFANKIEGKIGKRFSDYAEEFDYLISAGIALEVKAISQPRFPMLESSQKNLLKLYLNDVGILTCLLYDRNISAVIDDFKSINLGSVYESVVAQELFAHCHQLYYYDNKKHGEIDFLIEDFDSLSVMPIEVKSGKDYRVHSALDNFLRNPDYHIKEAIVLSNNREVTIQNGITYLPIYYVMFL